MRFMTERRSMEWSAMRSENPMLSDVDYVEKDLRFYFVESLDVLRDFFGSIAGNEEKRRRKPDVEDVVVHVEVQHCEETENRGRPIG